MSAEGDSDPIDYNAIFNKVAEHSAVPPKHGTLAEMGMVSPDLNQPMEVETVATDSENIHATQERLKKNKENKRNWRRLGLHPTPNKG